MPTDTAKIERWYDAKAEWEWNRTQKCRVEFAVTLRVVREHFPAPPAAVLDVGGGPGRYAIALAEQGYRVTLLDLSAGCLEFARQQAAERRVPLAAYVHGNAMDLAAFADASFPAVLSLGPFYHLLTAAERQRALAEARRVLAPGGVLVAAFLCRFAAVRFWGHVRPEATARHLQRELAILATGVMLMGGADPGAGGWVDAYAERPEAIRPFMEAGGFQTLDLVGADGVCELPASQEKTAAIPDELWPAYVDLNYRLGHEPSMLGAAHHLLYVGRKP